MGINFRSGIDSTAAMIEWVWPNRVMANTINMISGRKGAGKSSAVSALLGHWKTGSMPDGSTPHRKLRRVIWFSSEEDYDSVIAPRAKANGINPDDIMTIDRREMTGLPLYDLAKNYTHLRDVIVERKVDAVIVDPYTELKSTGFASKDDGATRDYLTLMITLAQSTSSTWLLMGHCRKAKSNHPLDELAGSVQIAATCRSVIRCDHPDHDKPDRYFSVLACNLAEPTLPVSYTIQRTKSKVPVCKFGTEVQLTMDEIIDLTVDKESRDVLADAKLLLCRCLSEGKKNAADILKEAKQSAIGEKTLRTAKTQMGIRSVRVVDPVSGLATWQWCHPDDGDHAL